MSASDPPKPPPGSPQIQVDLDEATAQGLYANLVLINHTDAEFILDFAFLQPTDAAGPGARAHPVVPTPHQAPAARRWRPTSSVTRSASARSRTSRDRSTFLAKFEVTSVN